MWLTKAETCGKQKAKNGGIWQQIFFYNTICSVGRIGYGVFKKYEERGNLKRGKCGEGKLKSIRGTVGKSAVDRTNVCQV